MEEEIKHIKQLMNKVLALAEYCNIRGKALNQTNEQYFLDYLDKLNKLSVEY
jgi:hypothetical protein